MTTLGHRPARLLLVAFIASGAFALAACSSAVPPASDPPSVPPSASSGPTTAPRGSDADSGGDPGTGSSGSTGSGIVIPRPVAVEPADPPAGQATLVRPRPGQRDPRPVGPIKLEASIDGRHVLVKVSWYGGVEPCSVLDSVRVERSGMDIAITPLEGNGDPDAMCIEIALLKATIVDLGDLEPGTWRIVAPTGDAQPLELTIA